MTADEEKFLLTTMILLKDRITVLEKRMQGIEGLPMCPLCRESFTTTQAFIDHYKRRHP